MAAMEPWFELINFDQITKHEMLLLDADIFTRICEQIKYIINQNNNYPTVIKLNDEVEESVSAFEPSIIQYIITDILSSEAYSISGIAYYVNSPVDVIYEIILGNNKNPSFTLSRRIIELHRAIRPHLYQELIKKIVK